MRKLRKTKRRRDRKTKKRGGMYSISEIEQQIRDIERKKAQVHSMLNPLATFGSMNRQQTYIQFLEKTIEDLREKKRRTHEAIAEARERLAMYEDFAVESGQEYPHAIRTRAEIKALKHQIESLTTKKERKYKMSILEETIMKKQFNTVEKVIKELERLSSSYCSDSEMKGEERKIQCEIKINGLRQWLDELVKVNPPSFQSMIVQNIPKEEWHIEELNRDIHKLPIEIRKLQLALNSVSGKEEASEVNKLRQKHTNRIQQLNALRNQRKANMARYTHRATNTNNELPPPRGHQALRNHTINVNSGPYSPTVMENYVKRPNVNVKGTRHLRMMLPAEPNP